MQLTINLNDLSDKKRLGLFALLNLIDETTVAQLRIEQNYQELAIAEARQNAVHPNQAVLPMEEPPANEIPIKKRTVKPKEVVTSDEKPKEVSEPTQEVKPSSVGLQEVKELAQTMVAKHDRESVKAIISVYGEKLTEVKEADYQKLFDALNALND